MTSTTSTLVTPRDRSQRVGSDKEGETTSPSPSVLAGEGTVEKKEEAGTGTDEEAGEVQPQEPANAEYPSGFALGLIVFALVLSIFLIALDMTIVATAIPKITDEFKGLDQVSWYGAAFFMCVAAFQSTCKFHCLQHHPFSLSFTILTI